MRTEVDVNKIANIVADIQTAQEAVDRVSKQIIAAERELEDDRAQLQDEQDNIRSLRDELDAYLDELIPASSSERTTDHYDDRDYWV